MWELRWILAGLGAALLVVLYLWGRYARQRVVLSNSATSTPSASPTPIVSPIEPLASDTASARGTVVEPAAPDPHPNTPTAKSSTQPRKEKVIALRLIPRSEQFSAAAAITALEHAGLAQGRYGIFHYCAPETDFEIFSVANLVEPGSFDIQDIEHDKVPGMTFFMLLPGPLDAVSRFDQMVRTARMVAIELEGDLVDDRGSSWSIQRERYIREELIRYRLKPQHE